MVITVPNIQLCNLNILLSSIVLMSIFLSRSLMSDFNSFLTLSILLSSSLNLLSIFLSSSFLMAMMSDFSSILISSRSLLVSSFL
ncbi:hypothetical protein bmLB2001_001026 (plasmid) [Borrelia miyamotoi]|nr:hypothetical protein bmLB2001_001206 [Borrelia miyamotoi]QTL84378.1 hypothetical protein bmLB2001_001026 [Borrelia miyamotoi]